MAGTLVTRTLDRTRALRKLPVGRLVVLAELVLLVRDHVNKLEPHERRRLVELAKIARFQRGNLTGRERRELTDLLAKTEPRAFVNRAVAKSAGVPIPRRGRSRR